MACHPANVACRTHAVVRFHATTRMVPGNPEGGKLWERACHRAGWDLNV
jgi:hypothetical protein